MWDFDYSKEDLEEYRCTIADVTKAREYVGMKSFTKNFLGENYDKSERVYNCLSFGVKQALRLMADSGEIN